MSQPETIDQFFSPQQDYDALRGLLETGLSVELGDSNFELVVSGFSVLTATSNVADFAADAADGYGYYSGRLKVLQYGRDLRSFGNRLNYGDSDRITVTKLQITVTANYGDRQITVTVHL